MLILTATLARSHFVLLTGFHWLVGGGVVGAGNRTKICPVAPAGAEVITDQFIGWFAWFLVWVAFPAGLLASIAAILAGRVMSMPHVGKGGLIGLLVVLGAALLYLVVPGIVASFLGDGCISR